MESFQLQRSKSDIVVDQSEDGFLFLPHGHTSLNKPKLQEVERSGGAKDSPKASMRRKRWTSGTPKLGPKEFTLSAGLRSTSSDGKWNAETFEDESCKSCVGFCCLSCNLRDARSTPQTPPLPSYSALMQTKMSWGGSSKSRGTSSRSSFSDSESSRSGRKQRRSSILRKAVSSVASGVDMGYSGSEGLTPQQFTSNNTTCGYICYGFGEFDGQGSGHDFSGNDWHSAFGFVNNCDGSRSHTHLLRSPPAVNS